MNNFDEIYSVRFTPEQDAKITSIIEGSDGKFTSKSQFIRVAIIRLIRRERGEE